MFKTTLHIITGWFRFFFKKKTERDKERLKTCNACTPSPFCPMCGCFKKAMVLVEDEECKLNKWKN